MCSVRAPAPEGPPRHPRGAAAAAGPRRARGTWRSWWTVLGLITALVPAVADASRLSDRIVAIVNDEVITLSEVKAEISGEERRLRQEYEGAALERRLRQLERQTLTALIERKLQMQLAEERGHVATDEEARRAMRDYLAQNGENGQTEDASLMKSMKEQLTVLRVLEREVRSGVLVSEQDLKAYYEQHKDFFMLPAEFRISQILIRPRAGEDPQETRRRVDHALAALQDGGDFARVATEHSDGAGASQGGSLGQVREGELAPSLEQAISKLQPGEVSDVIETERGYHILRVDERTPPQYKDFSLVKAQIQSLVYKEKSEDLYHRWIDELKDNAYIEVKF